MKRFTLVWLALASVCSAVVLAVPQERPRYGGTLRVVVPSAIRTLDPAHPDPDPAAAAAQARVSALVLETLVRLEDDGGIQPWLASGWQKDSQGLRWTFTIRRAVMLHDGTPLTPSVVTAALQRANPSWTIRADGDDVAIELPVPTPDLPCELAEPRNGVSVLAPGGQIIGTGPFRLDRWTAGRQADLRAHDTCWHGRPFIDAIHFEMGRRAADSSSEVELGQAHVTPLLPQDVRRATSRALRIVSLPRRELVALVVDRPGGDARDLDARRALARAVDRQALSTLLQRQAEPTGALLPQELSGYAFLFPVEESRAEARAIVPTLPVSSRSWSLQVDPLDPVLQLIAGRLILDAREAGLSVTMAARGQADLRLLRRSLPLSAPNRALATLAADFGVEDASDPPGLPRNRSGVPLDLARSRETSLLERHAIVPLLYLPELFVVSPRLCGWDGPARPLSGSWRFEDAWLRPE